MYQTINDVKRLRQIESRLQSLPKYLPADLANRYYQQIRRVITVTGHRMSDYASIAPGRTIISRIIEASRHDAYSKHCNEFTMFYRRGEAIGSIKNPKRLYTKQSEYSVRPTTASDLMHVIETYLAR